jgi:hypothetical protein
MMSASAATRVANANLDRLPQWPGPASIVVELLTPTSHPIKIGAIPRRRRGRFSDPADPFSGPASREEPARTRSLGSPRELAGFVRSGIAELPAHRCRGVRWLEQVLPDSAASIRAAKRRAGIDVRTVAVQS